MSEVPVPVPVPVISAFPITAAPPDLPSGFPTTDASKPAWALTQAQIDFLVSTAGKFWPTFKSYWPIIVLIASALGIGGGIAGRATAPVEKETTVIEKPVQVDVKPSSYKQTVYAITTATDPMLLKDHPSGVVEVYPAGTGYLYKGVVIPLPVVIQREGASDVSVEALR